MIKRDTPISTQISVKKIKYRKPMPPICESHKAHVLNLGYVAFFDECERRRKLKMKQKQCPVCKRYLFEDEF